MLAGCGFGGSFASVIIAFIVALIAAVPRTCTYSAQQDPVEVLNRKKALLQYLPLFPLLLWGAALSIWNMLFLLELPLSNLSSFLCSLFLSPNQEPPYLSLFLVALSQDDGVLVHILDNTT